MIKQMKFCTVPGCNYPEGQCSGACWSDDEVRMDIIGQNGNDGDHYDAVPAEVDMINHPPHLLQVVDADCLLTAAAKHMRDRAATYDAADGERSMGKAVTAFNAITGRDLSEPEGWLLLQVLKDVRLFQRPGYHADSAEDCIAYAALKAEAKAKEVL